MHKVSMKHGTDDVEKGGASTPATIIFAPKKGDVVDGSSRESNGLCCKKRVV